MTRSGFGSSASAEGLSYIYIYIYIYISAEANMASGRVDAGPPILETFSSPQSGEGFLPLSPPTAPAWQTIRFRERLVPLGFAKCFRVWAPKDPSRTFQGPPRIPQEPPRAPSGLPKEAPKAPEGSPRPSQEAPNAQNAITTIATLCEKLTCPKREHHVCSHPRGYEYACIVVAFRYH